MSTRCTCRSFARMRASPSPPARTPRRGRPCGPVSRIRRNAARVDLRLAAKTVAVRQLGRHRLSRPRRAGMPLQPARAATTSPSSDACHRRRRRARDRDCAPRRPAPAHRREDRPHGGGLLSELSPPLLSDPLVDFIGEVGEAENRGSWATPRRSSFRSTGRSRSGLR